MSLLRGRLRFSTSHHPQTDGSSEILNRMFGNYLRCFCNTQQTYRNELLCAAEYAHHSAVVEGTG